MIQRIQSLYLLIATGLFFIMLGNPIAQIQLADNTFLTFNHNEIFAEGNPSFNPVSTWQVSVLIAVIMLIGVIDIFLFRKRTLQMRLCVFNILLMFGLVGLIYFYTKYAVHKFDAVNSVFLWPIVVPFISIILTYLALKGIQKDDALVKSYDRLR
jgi:peptidoglycan/LPS O-acetylase OafA/YrhL